jgi:hypothetical protein
VCREHIIKRRCRIEFVSGEQHGTWLRENTLSRGVVELPLSSMALFARDPIVFSCSLATFEAELDVLGKEVF